MKQSFSRLFGLNDKNDDAELTANEEVQQLAIKDIVPNRFQPRTLFDEDRIAELAQTIRTHGVIQPIVVRVRDDKYEIIAGERRWRAVTSLQWETIPAIVKEFNDSQTASIALIENLQREGLTAIEEATAYAKLIEIHNLTQESLAQRLGKGQSTIANKLRLLHLPQAVQDAILNRDISERHARALIALKDAEAQEAVLKQIIEEQLNVKQTEERVKAYFKTAEEEAPKKKKPKRKSYPKDMRIAMNTIRQSVDMVMKSGLKVDTDEEDNEEFYQFTIRIPKKK
ncbi:MULTISPECIES: nucleoid occlusion protein [Shouchella]|jgi:ParB family transcriptional regulator, chromosome partitioning protein|uniref:Nucleoid occlusion protein n=1 Tax=Shouchella clausii (strain KSM-K16) TaxID=66692 RepID=NOC_SHOC1|nr:MULTISPECIES: nucleoid occlusion protein [Shouchella]Q5WAG6.1 RecName: Full=Nucleoid occlusion protein; Short=Noc [Shouchella clausii KSM-K16]KKI86551.1 chromosome partitioning protein ParB [Shouchella clausii]MBX0319085.1 nucleoid occlusion protein [Shouchella clausii]MCM3381073.1 nucleoid occlusion protein [Shouchella rhizosphaerae]MCM3547799.1 nucleoid occlusion protein [Shouchella clausii]MCR1288092.1 nucleoid occlusion protein [Shouchella clausii]